MYRFDRIQTSNKERSGPVGQVRKRHYIVCISYLGGDIGNGSFGDSGHSMYTSVAGSGSLVLLFNRARRSKDVLECLEEGQLSMSGTG